MNTAYKHLDTKLRIASLTVTQWSALVVGVGVAILWGFYLSPLGTYLTIGTAVYAGAVPASFALMSTFYEIDLGTVVVSALRWTRLNGRFLPGPGEQAEGYVVRHDDPDATNTAAAVSGLDLSALWDS